MSYGAKSHIEEVVLRKFGRGFWLVGSGQIVLNAAFATIVSKEKLLSNGAMTESRAALDSYLAQCVACFRRSQPIPAWPNDFEVDGEMAAARVSFHGISLLLVETSPDLPGWPIGLAERAREEARLQRFWEQSHAGKISLLLDALYEAGIEAVVIKGSALAYSLYPDPAFRRRGDSDILITGAKRSKARSVLVDCGFARSGDIRPLQESWHVETRYGFDHMVDVHWRVNASSAIADLLEMHGAIETKLPLPALSRHAQGADPVANLILTCINRASHEAFGYIVGNEKVFECDRLIWAVDIDLVCQSLSDDQWPQLVTRASNSGSSPFVRSALLFAQRTLETDVPEPVLERLAEHPGDDRLVSYFSGSSASARLRMDLAASPTIGDKARVLRHTILPGADSLHERFPDAKNWPVFALRARRIVAGVGKLIKGKR